MGELHQQQQRDGVLGHHHRRDLPEFHRPARPAFPRALPRITVPVLWVAGDADRTQANADALSAPLPGTVRNLMVHVSAPHLETPDAAIGPALDWLRPLQAG